MSNNRKDQIKQFAAMFQALSNPNRLNIFLRLVSGGEAGGCCETNGETCTCVGDLGRDLGIVPSTLSHHVKELHRAGLIQMERRGQNVECWIEPETLEALADFFANSHEDRSA